MDNNIEYQEKINESVETIKSWDRWKNFDFKKSLGKSKGLYSAKYKYTLKNGRTYYSLYRNNEWQGYTNTGAFKSIIWNNIKDYVVYANSDFMTYSNKELNSKKTSIKKMSIPMIVKGYYIINNKKYLSLYSTSDVWLGYIEENKVDKLKWINIEDKKINIKYSIRCYKSSIDLMKSQNDFEVSGKVIVKGYYKLGTTGTMASLYDSNNNWIGYCYGSNLK